VIKKRFLGFMVVIGLSVTALFPTPAFAASCSPAKQLASKNIKELHFEVLNAETGQQLLGINEAKPERTASVMKLLTAAVAIDVLGPEYQITTSVYADPLSPSKLYLVGAGDITLSRMPGNITSYYAKAPKLDTLTKQIASWAKLTGTVISEVAIDNSLYGSNADYHQTWDRRGLTQGYMAPVSALQIDAGRVTSTQNPNRWLAKRTTKPVDQAGQLFLASLNKKRLALGASVSQEVLPEGAVAIASVQSRPMSEWVSNMLRVSDNSLAEALARQSSLALGFDGSMESLTETYAQVLGARGLDVSKLSIIDASGLSRLNKVPAEFVNELLVLINQGVGNYSVIEAGMPVSGKSGSLRTRFATGSKVSTKGLVVAKTGFIRTGYSLAGFLTARDGTELIFTVYNLSPVATFNNRVAMDNLVYRLFQCGAKLSA
jgi:D-alanyl-D-alanine carboxypeptidase/D-alanyl-D-alanine-endopeptidase (penicillin-binding protein 4)